MNSNKLVFIVLLINATVGVNAQVSGISASKLNTINVDPVPFGSIELEPTFSTSRTGSEWDENGLNKLDSASTSSSVCWRMTYGLSQNAEFGLSIPSDFSSGSFGLKKAILQKDAFSLGAMAGVTLPIGNRTIDVHNRTIDDASIYGVGLIGSWQFSEESSIDVNVQYQDYFNSLGGLAPGGLLINMDYGAYVENGNIQLILGAGYQTMNIPGINANVLSLYPGLTIEYKKSFLIVVNTQHDLIGKNTSKTVGFNIALTTLW